MFFTASAQLDFEFTPIASGFSSPVDIANDGFNEDRLYIVQRNGVIKLLENMNGVWTTNSTDFLNIVGKVTSGGERGLLGLVFHPNFENNGYFYVNYTAGLVTKIERYTVVGNGTTADTNSDFLIYDFNQPATNHNGGDLAFGPNDGMLYIATGDGGGANDFGAHSQDLNDVLGKMLRLDIDSPSPYIPSDNPFVGDNNVLEEIWSYGLRNPWRFSFDRLTGDMWIGDVGQNSVEEVDFQVASSSGGENYGWDCYEADEDQYPTHTSNSNEFPHPDCFDENGNSLINHVLPAFDFGQNFSDDGGYSITGGYVYRGSFGNLRGHYFVADYITNNIWTVEKNGAAFDVQAYGNMGVSRISTFGEDVNGELYIAELNSGRILQITNNALPIQLISFDGSYKNKQVELNWTSAADFGASYFDIERSANGVDFKKIGKVEAQPNSNQTNNYTFIDKEPISTEFYYRLKMVEEDGSFEYSKSVVIYFKGQLELALFPNPNQGSFNLLVKGQTDEVKSVSIIIRSLTGQVMYRQNHLASLLPFNQQLFLENLPNGVYDVEVSYDGQILKHQMVKGK